MKIGKCLFWYTHYTHYARIKYQGCGVMGVYNNNAAKSGSNRSMQNIEKYRKKIIGSSIICGQLVSSILFHSGIFFLTSVSIACVKFISTFFMRPAFFSVP